MGGKKAVPGVCVLERHDDLHSEADHGAQDQIPDGEDQECYLGKPTLCYEGMWHKGYGRIAVVPSVNVGYDDEESTKVKQGMGGRRSGWRERRR